MANHSRFYTVKDGTIEFHAEYPGYPQKIQPDTLHWHKVVGEFLLVKDKTRLLIYDAKGEQYGSPVVLEEGEKFLIADDRIVLSRSGSLYFYNFSGACIKDLKCPCNDLLEAGKKFLCLAGREIRMFDFNGNAAGNTISYNYPPQRVVCTRDYIFVIFEDALSLYTISGKPIFENKEIVISSSAQVAQSGKWFLQIEPSFIRVFDENGEQQGEDTVIEQGAELVILP